MWRWFAMENTSARTEPHPPLHLRMRKQFQRMRMLLLSPRLCPMLCPRYHVFSETLRYINLFLSINWPLRSNLYNVKKNMSFDLKNESPRSQTEPTPQLQLPLPLPPVQEVSCRDAMPFQYLTLLFKNLRFWLFSHSLSMSWCITVDNSLQITKHHPIPQESDQSEQYVHMVEKTIAAWPKANKPDNLMLVKGAKSNLVLTV